MPASLATSHIIFNEVGAIARAVSYTPVAISMDFTSILTACRQVRTALKTYNGKTQIYLKKTSSFKRNNIKITHTQISNNQFAQLCRVEQRIFGIQKSLPALTKTRRGASDYLLQQKASTKLPH